MEGPGPRAFPVSFWKPDLAMEVQGRAPLLLVQVDWYRDKRIGRWGGGGGSLQDLGDFNVGIGDVGAVPYVKEGIGWLLLSWIRGSISSAAVWRKKK